jgi:hypothetical protein
VGSLPEGARPGVASKPAPTTIPHPHVMGGDGFQLRYIRLRHLIELKLAAGRAQDEADVIMLIQTNPELLDGVRRHLVSVHASYVEAFDRLAQRAEEQEDC